MFAFILSIFFIIVIVGAGVEPEALHADSTPQLQSQLLGVLFFTFYKYFN